MTDAPEPGTVYWLTGLAGAGKSSVARALVRRLRDQGRQVLLLDGDALRRELFPAAGYAPAERLDLARRYGALCALLAEQGSDVVCATISLFPEVWRENRRRLARYVEVLLQAPPEVLRARRPELDGRAAGGEHVVGADAPEPPAPELRLSNDGTRTPEELAEEVLAAARGVGAARAPVSGTKAELLERLAPRLRHARVLPWVRCTTAQWRADPEGVLARIEALAPEGDEPRWIVRSSALVEDVAGRSLAGRFPSVAGCTDRASLCAALERVAGALDAAAGAGAGADQLLVQPELTGVRMAGVALTRCPSTGAHVTTIVTDDSGRTDGITSGTAGERRTHVRHADATQPPPPELADVLALCEELVALVGHDALDVELARASNGTLVLFQVRLLALSPGGPSREGECRALAGIAARVEARSRPHPWLWGERAAFGTMPDWNPAEILGLRPRPLSLSLYRELVTDGIWAYQRSNYGYRNLRSFPLLVSLGGLPYVDVRVSFNSFLPADLDEGLGRRLVDAYVERLVARAADHDKVEFAIVHSCATPDLEERLAWLREAGFGADELAHLAERLRALTERLIGAAEGPFHEDLRRIDELERRQARFASEAARLDPPARIYWLLEDAKRWGTLPFAGIARAAFIAVQLLDSLVATGILAPEERAAFLRSLRTVRAELHADLARLPREAFLARYGHLRPSTYELTSPRWDEAPEAYFGEPGRVLGSAPRPAAGDARPFVLSAERTRRLEALFARRGPAVDAATLFAFLRRAIEERERAKLVFTRSLSDALAELARFGAELGFSRGELALADVEAVRRLYASSDDPREVLAASIREGRARWEITRRVRLPALLASPEEVWAFDVPPSEPSFVTLESASGPVVHPGSPLDELAGGVALIPSADPGFDWIFAHAPAALITMVGGCNSHMAIRAGELGVPAVLGAGEALFAAWSAARRLRVDCRNRRVEVLG